MFLQGGLRADCDDVIAPTTILNPEVDKNDVFGVYVSYVVRVKASLGTLRGDCVLDIPFVLAVPQEVGLCIVCLSEPKKCKGSIYMILFSFKKS